MWLAAAPMPGQFTVALDPGHGGTNHGAPSLVKGLYEKQVTLEIARRVRKRLAGDRGIKVVMCREHDALVTMRARVRCANEAGARLFISIHANASQTAGTQQGFETYIRPPEPVDHDAGLAALCLLYPSPSPRD